MGTYREAREVEREIAKDYSFDPDRTVEVDENVLELRDMTRAARMDSFDWDAPADRNKAAH